MRAPRLPPATATGLAVAVATLVAWGPADLRAQPGTGDPAYRGYLAVRLVDDGVHEVVDAHNADRLFVPASVLKLVTVAAALEHLGPEYRWVTRLTSTAAIDDGVLGGDLIVEPGADPTWGETLTTDPDGADGDAVDRGGGADEPLAALAGAVRERGVTRIAGDLVVDTGRFPGRRHPANRPFGDLPYRFGTPAAPLAVDEATVGVRVAPGPSVGAPARVVAPSEVEVINLATTVGRDRHGKGTLDFVPVWGTDTLLLRGEYPISEPPFEVSASDPAPERRAAWRLRDALAAAGVTLDGIVRVEARGAAGPPASVLVEHRSAPLAEVVVPILTDSHNWFADMLALTLGRDVAGTGRFDDGVAVIADFASARLDAAPDLPPAVWLEDGSGLALSNLVSPAVLVAVLAHALAQPWRDTFVTALATPGTGTLAGWPELPPLAAKTGTLRHTVALAGLVDADTPRPLLFCYFVNHHPERAGAARGEIVRAVRRWRASR